MRIVVDVAKWYDWEVRHESELEQGAVHASAQHLGPNLHLMRVQRDTPSETTIDVPDSDIAGMYEEHKQGVADAAKGGFPHPETGEPVASRALPLKTPKQLLADHIEAVMSHHAASEHITDVHVPTHPAFGAYLKARLVSGAGSGEVDTELVGAASTKETKADSEVLGQAKVEDKPRRSAKESL